MARVGRPKSENPKQKVLSVRLTDDLYQRLLSYTEKQNVSMTKAAIDGLELILAKSEK